MDKATQQRVFEPFFTTKPRGRGTGLGLATVFGIVSQSGGFIRVASQPGRGTRFELFFPRTNEPLAAVDRPPTTRTQRGAERVLLVEDDDAVRAVVSTILSEGGYDVMSATSLREARAAWSAHASQLALVITDMVLADGHGIDLATQVRAEQPALPILCMSGYAEREGIDSGPNGFAHLQKPFTADDLLGRVRRLIDRSDGHHGDSLRPTRSS
jgi:CheY-like chemotaxis protein